MIRSETIAASAGSGKTYALSMRYCELLLNGVSPESICALTFTRPATREIFNAIIKRLLECRGGEGALSERVDGVLEKLLEALPRIQVKTIDAFLAMVAKLFAYELGVNPAFSLYGEMEFPDGLMAQREIIKTLLAMYPGISPETFLEELNTLGVGEDDGGRLLQRLNGLLALAGTLQDAPAAVWGRLDGLLEDVARVHCREELYAMLRTVDLSGCRRLHPRDKTKLTETQVEKLLESIRRYPIKCRSVVEMKRAWGGDGKFETWCNDNNFGALCANVYKGTTLSLTAEQQRAAQLLLEDLFVQDLEETAELTRRMYRTLSHLAAAQRRWSGRSGMLSFTALTQLLGVRLGSKLSFTNAQLLDVGYRMNSALDHLMIDEFQDTSAAQWMALQNFATELCCGDAEKTFYYVGDVKQSIYGWRGGESKLFAAVKASLPIEEGAPLTESRRSAPEILQMVNEIFSFSEEFIAQQVKAYHRAVMTAWMTHWREHTPYVENPGGYVSVAMLGNEKISWEEALADVIQARYETLRTSGKKMTMAVLAFTNSLYVPKGDADSDKVGLLERLRKRRVPCALDGKKAVADTLIGKLILALLSDINEPQATFLRMIIRQLDIALGDPFEKRAQWSRVLNESGAPVWLDTLFTRAICAQLSDYDNEILENVRRCFVAMEEREERNPLQLMRALEKIQVPCAADEQVVSLMTIHHSKGLTYDVVFTVLDGTLEHPSMGVRPLYQTDDLVFLKPTFKETLNRFPQLKVCADRSKESRFNDYLCALYVGLTRARYEQHILAEVQFKPKEEKHEVTPLSKRADLIFNVFDKVEKTTQSVVHRCKTLGDVNWYRNCKKLVPITANVKDAQSSISSWKVVSDGSTIETELPSASAKEASVSTLLAPNANRARRGGVAFHERISKHTWGAFGDLFSEVFTPPAQPCTLWRERPFVVTHEAKRMSGQFDRVHLFEDHAIIYDYKTSAEPIVTPAYKKQMRAYRQALAHLTSLPLSAIQTILLFTATNTAVPVEFDT